MIPQLETGRLILRAFREEDLDAWASFHADRDFMRFFGGEAKSRSDAWRAMAMTLGHWMLRGFGMWAVERKSDGALLGRVGLLRPGGWPGLELGWALGRPHWGQGYATEAAAASLRYAFLTQPVERMLSCIDPGNIASQAVAMRLGETKGERTQLTVSGQTFPIDLWHLSREDWQRRV